MSSEGLDFVQLNKPNDDDSSCQTPESNVNNENSVESKEQQAASEQPASAIKQLDDSVLILSRIDRDSVVSVLVQTSTILQGDETIEKKKVANEIDLLLPALSNLPFNKANDSSGAMHKSSKNSCFDSNRKLNSVVFELTKDERMKIVGQLMNLKSYSILYCDSVSSETKSALIKENQDLVSLLLSGLPVRIVKCDAVISQEAKQEATVAGALEAEKVDASTVDCADERNKARSEARFTWKFERVGDLFKKNIYTDSETFYCQQIPWFISIQPNQVNGESFLAIYLNVDNEGGDLKSNCKTSFEVRLLATRPGVPDKVKKLNYVFAPSKTAFGATRLIAHKELMDVLNGYLRTDSILVQVLLKAGPAGPVQAHLNPARPLRQN